MPDGYFDDRDTELRQREEEMEEQMRLMEEQANQPATITVGELESLKQQLSIWKFVALACLFVLVFIAGRHFG